MRVQLLKRLPFVVSLLVWLPSSAEPQTPWPTEPDTYRYVQFGVNLDEAAKSLSLTCDIPKFHEVDGFTYRDCKSKAIVDFPGVMSEVLHFMDERLEGVTIIFDSEAYDRVRALLVAKYGEPTWADSYVASNGWAAERGLPPIQYEIEGWDGKRVSLLLSPYVNFFDRGIVRFRSQVFVKAANEAKRRRDEKAKKAF